MEVKEEGAKKQNVFSRGGPFQTNFLSIFFFLKKLIFHQREMWQGQTIRSLAVHRILQGKPAKMRLTVNSRRKQVCK